MNTNRSLFLGIVIAVVIALVAFMAFRSSRAPEAVQSPDTTQTTGTTTGQTASSTTVGGVTITGPGTIEMVDSGGTKIPTPSLTRPITFSADVSAEIKTYLTGKEQDLIAQLKKAPTRTDLWLQLGLYRKQAGDYTGAAEAWTYVAKVAPTEMRTTAYADLGDLYMNFVHDNAKAEVNFKAAVALTPKYVQGYHDLFNLYHYTLKDDIKAAAILKAGLKANPNNTELLEVQKQFQAGK